jgi:hypothetical protein
MVFDAHDRACQRAPKFPQKWAFKIPQIGDGGLRSVISRWFDHLAPLQVAGRGVSGRMAD